MALFGMFLGCKKGRVRLVTNLQMNRASDKLATNSIEKQKIRRRGIKEAEGMIIFKEDTDGQGCCNRCAHPYLSNGCVNASCDKIDRADGKSGYFIDDGRMTIKQRISAFIKRIWGV